MFTTAIEGELCELSVLSQGRGVDTATTTFAVLAKCNNTQTVTVIHIPNTVANGGITVHACPLATLFFFFLFPVPSKLYSVANTKELSDEFVSRQTVALAEPITGLTLAPKNTLFALLECKNKFSKFILPAVEQEVSTYRKKTKQTNIFFFLLRKVYCYLQKMHFLHMS